MARKGKPKPPRDPQFKLQVSRAIKRLTDKKWVISLAVYHHVPGSAPKGMYAEVLVQDPLHLYNSGKPIEVPPTGMEIELEPGGKPRTINFVVKKVWDTDSSGNKTNEGSPFVECQPAELPAEEIKKRVYQTALVLSKAQHGWELNIRVVFHNEKSGNDEAVVAKVKLMIEGQDIRTLEIGSKGRTVKIPFLTPSGKNINRDVQVTIVEVEEPLDSGGIKTVYVENHTETLVIKALPHGEAYRKPPVPTKGSILSAIKAGLKTH